MRAKMEACPGCGLHLPAVEGPTDRYGGASPSCWALFGEVLARDYGLYQYPEAHRLIVDAYMAQHPGYATPSGRRSVAVHLVALLCVLEMDLPGPEASRIMAGLFPQKRDIAAFEPVPWLGEVTVAHVHAAQDLEEHSTRARAWAEAVWQAWSLHHARVRALLSRTRA